MTLHVRVEPGGVVAFQLTMVLWERTTRLRRTLVVDSGWQPSLRVAQQQLQERAAGAATAAYLLHGPSVQYFDEEEAVDHG